jgi:FkbH-like protein
LSFSAEDRQRGELYRKRAMAEDLKGQSGSLEDFLRSLQMTVVCDPVREATLARSAQLTQKTNQFNATTRRYSEPEVGKRMIDPAWLLETVTVTDRFGDHGVVGLVMARAEDEALAIDTFLLSCRVIGRTVETAMLASLCEHAARRGLTQLRAKFISTAKNAPAKDLYERHGFARVGGDGPDESLWLLDLSKGAVVCPEWIRLDRSSASAGLSR